MVTLYLATVLGWYLIIISLFLLWRRDIVSGVMGEIMGQRGLLFILAVLTVILGLLMVVSHNVWVIGWPVVVTLLSWLVLISGLLRLLFPDIAIRMAQGFQRNPNRLIAVGVVLLIIGIFLLFNVYYGSY
jgi:hypothetical protein